MKWCQFQSGQKLDYGIIDDDTVTEVTGSPFESTDGHLLVKGGDGALDWATPGTELAPEDHSSGRTNNSIGQDAIKTS